MSAPPEFPDDALSLRNELLLLLLDLRYKKNGICSLVNSAEFRRKLSNEFLADLVCFSFSLPWHCLFSFLSFKAKIPTILERMKNDFPPSIDWSVSTLEDIRSWLPNFSNVPSSRELVLIDFDIRSYGDLIASFDNSRVPLANQDSEMVPISLGSETDVSKNSIPLPLTAANPIPTVLDALPSTSTRSVRSTRGKTARDEPVGNTVAVPEVLINAPSDSTIRVKRSVRVKKASAKVGGEEETEFLHKVNVFYRLSLCRFISFFLVRSLRYEEHPLYSSRRRYRSGLPGLYSSQEKMLVS
jgi:hypothetical protein